ncbi:hypothetical protein [Sphaerisporangium rhizosphaerae]|uniref:Fibronectin type-III domain-containing protein n=1 Tax=Sphaerisporangium rhizosphaerae TaxID=2269375 RepID=A0ABW2NVR0_9ACTN
MSDLLAGTKVNALDFPPAVYASDTTQIDNPTNASYVAGTPEVGVTFIAPTSGRVWLIVGGGVGNSTGADRIFLSPEVRETNSSGAVVLAPSVITRGFSGHQGASTFHYASRRTLLSGLIPGKQYYARVMYAVATSDSGASTADIACRDITVAPAT